MVAERRLERRTDEPKHKNGRSKFRLSDCTVLQHIQQSLRAANRKTGSMTNKFALAIIQG